MYVAYTEFGEADETLTTRLLRSDDGGLTWTDLNKAGPKVRSHQLWPMLDTTTSPSAIYLYDDTGTCTGRATAARRGQARYRRGAGSLRARRNPRSQPRPAAGQQAVDAFLASCDGTITDADTGAVVPIANEDWILADPTSLHMYLAAVVLQSGAATYTSHRWRRTWRRAGPTWRSRIRGHRYPCRPNTPRLSMRLPPPDLPFHDGGAEWS